MAPIATWIARHRRRLGLSQEELAAHVGVGQQAVSAWERERTEPAQEVLEQLVRLFGESAPQLRHLRALEHSSEDKVPDTAEVLTRRRFALEVFEPRLQRGPLSDGEVALLRDAARTLYGFDLGGAYLEGPGDVSGRTQGRRSALTGE